MHACILSTCAVWATAVWDPPTVAVTKRKFLEGYSKPVSGIYDAVLQELLVQQHLIRYNKKYQYDPVCGAACGRPFCNTACHVVASALADLSVRQSLFQGREGVPLST